MKHYFCKRALADLGCSILYARPNVKAACRHWAITPSLHALPISCGQGRPSWPLASSLVALALVALWLDFLRPRLPLVVSDFVTGAPGPGCGRVLARFPVPRVAPCGSMALPLVSLVLALVAFWPDFSCPRLPHRGPWLCPWSLALALVAPGFGRRATLSLFGVTRWDLFKVCVNVLELFLMDLANATNIWGGLGWWAVWAGGVVW